MTKQKLERDKAEKKQNEKLRNEIAFYRNNMLTYVNSGENVSVLDAEAHEINLNKGTIGAELETINHRWIKDGVIVGFYVYY